MDIIAGYIDEVIVKNFTADDWGDFKGILNDNLSMEILLYTKKSDADKDVVEAVNKYLGSSIHRLTMHMFMHEKGVVETVRTLTPETIPEVRDNHEELLSKLEYLEKNYSYCLPQVPVRGKQQFNAFKAMLVRVLSEMNKKGIRPKYPDLLARVNNNSFVFVDKATKARPTGTAVLSSRVSAWRLALEGIRYIAYCDSAGIPEINRRAF